MRALFLLAILAAPVSAQLACPQSRVLMDGSGPGSVASIRTDARLTYSVKFDGETVSSASVSCTEKSKGSNALADPTPNNMVVPTPVPDGDTVRFALQPARGATPSTMRKGRGYQCQVTATTADGDIIPVDVCVTVKNQDYTP